jgi:uncharacterized protein (TIRG00374 family)
VAGFVLVGVACWVVAGKSSELSGINSFLSKPHWVWLVVAAAVELVSFLAMASLQRGLLRAGDIRTRLSRVTLITFASNSIQSSLPVGAAFAALFEFGQYQGLGADDVLAGWVVVATGGVLFVAVAGLAGLGLGMAASTGNAFDLVGAIVGVIVLAALAAILWSRRAQISVLLLKAVVAVEKLFHRPDGQVSQPLARGLARMRSVAPTKREWARFLGWGVINWSSDCSCWGFAFLAVGTRVPWQGLLLAYCAGQLAATLPITPGGLGVVEGTLTVALVAFVPQANGPETVAAVLLYRVLSFWVPLPVGAACWAVLLRARRRRARLAPPATMAPNTELIASDGAATLDGHGPAPAGLPVTSELEPVTSEPEVEKAQRSGNKDRAPRKAMDMDESG